MGIARRPLLVLLLAVLAGAAWADDEVEPERPIPPPGFVEVPDVRRLTPDVAARRLVFAGLNPGRLYDRKAQAGWTLGRVLQQRPAPGTVLAWGTKVDLAISASADGPAAGRAPPANWPRVALPGRSPAPPAPPAPAQDPEPETVPGDQIPPPPPPPPTAPRTPAPAPPQAPEPSPTAETVPGDRIPPPPPPPPAEVPAAPVPVPVPGPEAEPVPGPEPVPEPAPEVPVPAGAVPEEIPLETPQASPEEATGSPDAPAAAPTTDPSVVPALLGLSLADAEHLATVCDMKLHVERVPGQPVGRVQMQQPEPGAPRPAGGVLRVVVAAGGDHVGELAPAPQVAVTEIAVPDLLDRTELQACRILEDLGLEPQVEEAVRGPAGRVADQRPDAGTVVPKGSKVIVRVAPAAAAQPAPPTPTPAPPVPPVGGAPAPLSPAPGTAMGTERTLAIGFTWRPLAGADAYVLEVEEQGPEGWLPLARTSARSAAAVLEIERLAPRPGSLRWRVRAVTAGRQGAPCAWVLLR